jgi:hypothetical protein
MLGMSFNISFVACWAWSVFFHFHTIRVPSNKEVDCHMAYYQPNEEWHVNALAKVRKYQLDAC